MDYFFNLLNHYGLWLGFVLVAIENIGIPFPIEFVYLFGQNLISTGQSNFTIMMIFFTAAHLTGSIIAYYLGLFSNTFIAKWFNNNKGLIKTRARIEIWYKKYGSVTNFMTRLIGYVRPWSSFIAGFGRENIYTFLVWTLLGTIIFNFIALLFSGAIIYFWLSYPIAKYLISGGFVFFFAIIWLFLPKIAKRLNI